MQKKYVNHLNRLDTTPHKNGLNFFVLMRPIYSDRETWIFIMSTVLAFGTISATSLDLKVQAQRQSVVNWEQLCIQYGGLVGIHTPCSELAHGPFLTEQGKGALACLFGGGTLLLLGVDPTTVAIIGKAAREVCP
jgi:hypothetical protein